MVGHEVAANRMTSAYAVIPLDMLAEDRKLHGLTTRNRAQTTSRTLLRECDKTCARPS
jgi:hypothetical protein